MFHKILIPLDGSSASEGALAYLDHLRTEQILLARVYGQTSEAESVGQQECMEYLKGLRARLASMLDIQLACVPGEPAEAILRLAESAGCDLILMTSHGGRGTSSCFLGSIAENVTRHAICPVLLVGRQAVAPAPDSAAQAALARAQELVEGCL